MPKKKSAAKKAVKSKKVAKKPVKVSKKSIKSSKLSKSCVCTYKFKPHLFATACGLTFAISMFLLGLSATFGWGVKLLDIIGSMYVGFAPSLSGAIIGAIYAFVDGYIGGYIFAWIYNKLQ